MWSNSPYGQMTAAAALLAPPENWQQRTQQKMQEAMMWQQIRQNAEAEAKTFQAQQAATVEAFQQLESLPMLDPDQRQWTVAASDLRHSLAKRIMDEYGGDAHKFMQREGLTSVQTGIKGMLSSPLYRQATENKATYTQFQADLRAGKLDAPVSYEYYNPKTGAQETVKGNMATQFAEYLRGNVRKLTYNGAYEPPKDFFDFFSKTPHPDDPEGVYDSKRKQMVARPVTKDDMLAYALQKGMTPETALDWVGRGFGPGGYKTGMLTWKQEQQRSWDASKDAWSRQMDMANLSERRASRAQADRHHQDRMAAASAASGGNNTSDVLGFLKGNFANQMNPGLGWGKMGQATQFKLLPANAQSLIRLVGGAEEPNRKNGQILDWGTLNPGIQIASGTGGRRTLTGEYKLKGVGRDVRVIDEPILGPGGKVVGRRPRAYMEAYVVGDGEDLTRDGIYNEGMLWDNDTDDFRGDVKPLDGWWWGHNTYQARVYLPVEYEDQAAASRTVSDLKIGDKRAASTYAQETAAGVGDDFSQMQSAIQNAVNR